jgi:hypothetical protein
MDLTEKQADDRKEGTNKETSENVSPIGLTEIAAIAASVSEADMKRGIILRCNNAALSQTTFYYCQNKWNVFDMAEASVGKWGAIAIRFKDGKTRKFRLAPSVNAMESAGEKAVEYRTVEFYFDRPGHLGLEELEVAIGGVGKLVKSMNQQWVATINALIYKQKKSDQL